VKSAARCCAHTAVGASRVVRRAHAGARCHHAQWVNNEVLMYVHGADSSANVVQIDGA